MFDDMDRFFERLDKQQDDLYDCFKKLMADPCMEIPDVGDRVVVAAGPLLMGHSWIRLEAVVVETAQSSYKIRFADREDFKTGLPLEKWVHPAVVTDVIRQQKGGA